MQVNVCNRSVIAAVKVGRFHKSQESTFERDACVVSHWIIATRKGELQMFWYVGETTINLYLISRGEKRGLRVNKETRLLRTDALAGLQNARRCMPRSDASTHRERIVIRVL